MQEMNPLQQTVPTVLILQIHATSLLNNNYKTHLYTNASDDPITKEGEKKEKTKAAKNATEAKEIGQRRDMNFITLG
jgi:hypothetical protein